MSIYASLVQEGQSADQKLVDVERRGHSALVTLADPERLNVLSAPLVIQVRQALDELTADPAVRAIVLTGAGEGVQRRRRPAHDGTR